jgi:hypothetical protein
MVNAHQIGNALHTAAVLVFCVTDAPTKCVLDIGGAHVAPICFAHWIKRSWPWSKQKTVLHLGKRVAQLQTKARLKQVRENNMNNESHRTSGQLAAIEQLLLCLIRELDISNVIDGNQFRRKTAQWALQHRVADPQNQDQQAKLAGFDSTMRRLLEQLESASCQTQRSPD